MIMRPQNLKTKIFLDSGNPAQTKEALELIGFLDGQTTNPSLIAKHPEAQKRIASGNRFSVEDVRVFYKDIVTEIESLLGEGTSISVEVAADASTKSSEIIAQAQDMKSWISHPHIKIPITHEGLVAGEQLVSEGVHLNYTLNFSQQQAAAVHAASRESLPEQVYISPFRGRLDDSGVAGASVINNIQEMYASIVSPVGVLVASVRDYETFLYALYKEVDIITVPFKILTQWAHDDLKIPSEMEDPVYGEDVMPAPMEDLDLSASWQSFDLSHTKTDEGLAKFAADWAQIVDVDV